MATKERSQTSKQRVAAYRARRKAKGLCIEPGCESRPRKYVRCPFHREAARIEQGNVRLEAALYRRDHPQTG